MRNNENIIFFKSLLKAPLKTGAVFPSSKNLASAISGFVNLPNPDEYILEIGAGTGRLTSALLERGVPATQLIILEMQPFLAKFLKKIFHSVTILEGNATNLLELLPEKAIGNIQTVVSGIPMVNLRFQAQQQIITAIKNIIKPDGTILQFTYRPGSPLPSHKLGLKQNCLGHILFNIPPASIWEYKTTNHATFSTPFRLKDQFKFKRKHAS